MSENETKSASPIPTVMCAQCCDGGGDSGGSGGGGGGGSGGGSLTTIQCPALQVTSRMLRSPSHESVTTDLSLFSVSSIASDLRSANRLVTFKSYSDAQLTGRGPSPKPDRQIQGNRPADIPEILWFEEENELIRSCGVLSSALGLRKSFSTSDVSQLPSPDAAGAGGLRTAVSALALDTAQRNSLLLEHARLDHASRSCSTWVAVGEPVASTSQLPSPHGGTAHEQQPQQQQQQSQSQSQQLQSQQSSNAQSVPQLPPQPPAPPPPPVPFTGADLVRSVNKKVRQNYIRRRLLTTYRALERLSQSEFNLDQLEAAATAAQSSHGATLLVPGTAVGVPGASLIGRKERNHALTVRDVERERGNQLSKYERNMMIFNWLHTLDDSAVVDSVE